MTDDFNETLNAVGRPASSTKPSEPSSWANVTAHQNMVIIRHLSQQSVKDVEQLLHQTTLDSVTRDILVEEFPGLSVTVTFDHYYMATAAAAIIQHRGQCMFSARPEPPLATESVDTTLAVNEASSGLLEHVEQLSSDKRSEGCPPFEDNTSRSSPSIAPSELRTTSQSTINIDNAGTKSSSMVSNTDQSNKEESSGIIAIPLPVAPYSKARRILLPTDSRQPLLTVSMRADVNFVCHSTKSRLANRSIPNDSDPCRVVDAIVVNKHALIGYNGQTSQVAVVRINEKDERHTLDKLPQQAHDLIEQGTSQHHKYTSAITCITAQSKNAENIKFFTGGSDKDIRMWTLSTRDCARVTHKKLISLQTTPQAFAYTANDTLLVGSSTRLYTVNLSHLAVLDTARMSNGIHNILLHKQAPTVRILEVDHLDYQTQVFDDRKKSGYGRPPDILFGARAANGVPNRRHSRGDTNLSLYAKGFCDDTVKVWDYRNARKPVISQSFQQTARVTHTVFADPGTLICYSDKELVFVDLNKASTN